MCRQGGGGRVRGFLKHIVIYSVVRMWYSVDVVAYTCEAFSCWLLFYYTSEVGTNMSNVLLNVVEPPLLNFCLRP